MVYLVDTRFYINYTRNHLVLQRCKARDKVISNDMSNKMINNRNTIVDNVRDNFKHIVKDSALDKQRNSFTHEGTCFADDETWSKTNQRSGSRADTRSRNTVDCRSGNPRSGWSQTHLNYR